MEAEVLLMEDTCIFVVSQREGCCLEIRGLCILPVGNWAQYVGRLFMAYLATGRIDPGGTGFNHSGITVIESSAHHSLLSTLFPESVTRG